MSDTIKAYKAFDENMQCRGFQFEVGKTYKHEGKVEACQPGFHACTNPFDVWSYYDICGSRYAEVILSGETDNEDSDSKIAAGKITLEAEIKLPDFIRRCVDWVIDQTKGKDESGNSAKIGSSGDYAQIGSSGDYAQIGSSGDYAKIKAEGKSSVIASAGAGTHVEGVSGTWISLAEFNDDGDCIGFATGCIGQDGLKTGTKYKASGGKLVPA